MSAHASLDIADPESYGSSKSYRYLVYYGFLGHKYPKHSFFLEHTGGSAVISRPEKIRGMEDITALQKLIVTELKKTIWFWNGATLVVLGFSRFED